MMDDFPTTEVNQPKNPHKRDLKLPDLAFPTTRTLKMIFGAHFLLSSGIRGLQMTFLTGLFMIMS